MADDIVKFPFSNSPIWTYMEKYYQEMKKGPVMAEIYLRTHVPDPLQEQVKETVDIMLYPNKKR